MVEFTYQDYLKYEKYLKEEERKKKENKFMKFSEQDLDDLAKLLLKIEDFIEGKDIAYEEKQNEKKLEELKVMEESEPYYVGRKRYK